MFSKAKEYFLTLNVILHCLFVTSSHLERNGVTFVKETAISAGYSKWFSVTPVDTKPMFLTFGLLNAEREYLVQNPRVQRRDPVAQAIFKEKHKKLAELNEKAAEMDESIKIYTGHNLEESTSRSKRAFMFLPFLIPLLQYVPSFLGLAATVASTIYSDVQEDKQSEKLSDFKETFHNFFGYVNDSLEDIYSFRHDQISFNKHVVESYQIIDNNVKKIGEEFRTYIEDSNEALEEDYLISELTNSFQNLIRYQYQILEALVDAGKGVPHPMFLSPKVVRRVLLDYKESSNLDKSYYQEEDIAKLYNLVTVEVIRDGDQLALVHQIRIPTTTTFGDLYRIQSYPVHIPEENLFTIIEPEAKYLAINAKNQWISLTESDLNSCQKTTSLILCSDRSTLWRDRGDISCESSLYFEDHGDTFEKCNFKIIQSDTPLIQTVDEGFFHVAFPEPMSVPINCDDDTQPRNEHLDQNIFIELSPLCTATIGSTQLRNLVVDKEHKAIIKNDTTKIDLGLIRHIKKEDYNKTLQVQNPEPLNNQDIIEQLQDELELKATNDHVDDLFLKFNSTVVKQEKEALIVEQNITAALEDLDENNSDNEKQSQHSFILALLALLLVIILLVVYLIDLALKSRRKQRKECEQTELKKTNPVIQA